MPKQLKLLSCLLFSLFLLASIGLAQERGSVRGLVKSDAGQALENATVVISGPALPMGREYLTGKDGSFIFQALPPGKYTLVVTHPEMIDFTAEVIVAVARETFVNAVMHPLGKIQEEVTVVAATPVVDLKSTEVSSNWVSEVVQKLPLGRSYSSLFQLAPGVADNRDFAPNAGGNKQDNVYLYDGSNITNPFYGFLGANFSELDIQEVNIKRGGISAEFGRAAGMVTNAITKSGSNHISGTFRFIFAPSDFTWKSHDPNLVTKYDQYTPSIGLGGPILKDKVWWYVSANLPYSKTTGRINNLGPVPDAKNTATELFAKITANPWRSHLFAVSIRNNDYTEKNAGIGVNDHPSVAVNGDGLSRIIYASWVWTINQSTLLEVKYDHVNENYSSLPINELGYLPTPFNYVEPWTMGYFRTAAGFIGGGATASGQYVGAASEYNTQNFYRDEFKLVLTKYLDFTGHSHVIKVGFSYDNGGEYLERLANGWGSIITTTYSGQPAFRARYYSEQPAQDSSGRTYGLFIQDNITIGERFTLTLGLLANRDEFSSKTDEKHTFLTFNFDEEIQPRIGFTFTPSLKVRDKIFASFGRYNNMDNRSIARAAAPIRIYRTDAYIAQADGTVLATVIQGNETGKIILPDLKPTYTDEFVGGYSRPLNNHWSFEIWGDYRYVKHVIEDFPTRNRETSPSSYVYGNLDGQLMSWGNLPPEIQALIPQTGFTDFYTGKAKRTYKAVTLELKRQYADRWSFNLSYTWSRLEGNWDLDYQAGTALFYASSYIEDAPGLYLSDPNREGILSGDRTHVLKVFGTWEFARHFVLGGYLRVQSGAPWEKRGLDYYGNYFAYLEPAGSHRTKTWVNCDLQLSYEIPLGKFRSTIEARMMNLFDTQTALRVDVRGDQPTYMMPTSFAPPRTFALTLYVSF
ncbi:MAG TPA: TonB-dependent receptor [Candidatus Saccharicenans sp.]|nr:TonB-dependent receptor [Candidatus Saccharicenans sp.]HOT68627.1 TonB-dependent receptor [Candidatus Saccharicenans sp.]HQE63714.1 TonB-dependent receptor [Candidatus Saccharicenans sp.]HQH60536.1 TonB-dependent receptor [Candidatus Saccharicenans sp.]HQI21928.1 TonB-dependent receptor [Candidatus Saccharicenans sp.]